MARFLAVESCGQCTPCKRDGLALAERLTALCAGTGEPGDAATISDLLSTVADGAVAPSPASSRALSAASSPLPGSITDRRCRWRGRTAGPLLVAELVDIDDGKAIYDEEFASKQPDWTYDEVDSGSPRRPPHRPPRRLRRPPTHSAAPTVSHFCLTCGRGSGSGRVEQLACRRAAVIAPSHCCLQLGAAPADCRGGEAGEQVIVDRRPHRADILLASVGDQRLVIEVRPVGADLAPHLVEPVALGALHVSTGGSLCSDGTTKCRAAASSLAAAAASVARSPSALFTAITSARLEHALLDALQQVAAAGEHQQRDVVGHAGDHHLDVDADRLDEHDVEAGGLDNENRLARRPGPPPSRPGR